MMHSYNGRDKCVTASNSFRECLILADGQYKDMMMKLSKCLFFNGVIYVLSGAACLVGYQAQAQQAYFSNTPFGNEVREGLEEYNADGIDLGGFDLFPKLGQSMAYNDNIFAADENQSEDIISITSPSLRLKSDWVRNSISGGINLSHEQFFDNSSESETSGSAGLAGVYELGLYNSIRAAVNYENRAQARNQALSPNSSVERIRFETLGTELSFARTVNRLRVQLSYIFDDRNFDDGENALGEVIDQDFRDFDRSIYGIRTDYAISPSLALFVDNRYNTVKFDISSIGAIQNRDSEGFSVATGIDFDITDLIRGNASIGFFRQTFDDPLLDNTNGLLVRGGVDWFVTPTTNLELGLLRNRDEEAFAEGSDSVINSVSLGVRQRVKENVVLQGSFSYNEQNFQSFDREDENLAAGVSARYYIGPNVSTGLSYRYSERVSTGTDANNAFEQNLFLASLSLQL